MISVLINQEELVSEAALNGQRVERVRIAESGEERIRFIAWNPEKFQPSAVTVSEGELLSLLDQAIRWRVLMGPFVDALERLIDPAPARTLSEPCNAEH